MVCTILYVCYHSAKKGSYIVVWTFGWLVCALLRSNKHPAGHLNGMKYILKSKRKLPAMNIELLVVK